MACFLVMRDIPMVTVNLAQAKVRLSEVLDKVENGEALVITRPGPAVANLSAVSTPKQPLKPLAALRARMPLLRRTGASLLRDARDESL